MNNIFSTIIFKYSNNFPKKLKISRGRQAARSRDRSHLQDLEILNLYINQPVKVLLTGIKIGMKEYLVINNQPTTQNTSNWYPDWKGVNLIINQPVRVHSVGYINWREVFCHQPTGRNTSNWYTDWNCRDIL